MMGGQFREYNWRDITRLIHKDMGLDTDALQRTHGEMWCVGGFTPPVHEKDTCIRLMKYDKEFDKRLEEHVGD